MKNIFMPSQPQKDIIRFHESWVGLGCEEMFPRGESEETGTGEKKCLLKFSTIGTAPALLYSWPGCECHKQQNRKIMQRMHSYAKTIGLLFQKEGVDTEGRRR